MITVLHGENTTASRNAYAAMKTAVPEGTETRTVDGRNIDPALLEQAVTSDSLFGGKTAVFIENLFSGIGRKTKRIQAFGATLASASDAADIVLWEGKPVGREVLSSLPHGAKVQDFPYPKTVFQLLDGLSPGSARPSLELLSKTLETEEPEVVFALIVGRIRQLIEIRDGVTPDRASAWQMGRLTKQSALFTMYGLLAMHAELSAIDIDTKTGMSPLTLSQRLESLVLSCL
jgi:hypothetical protein